jgi:uncharacterized protein (TIGR03086 family)
MSTTENPTDNRTDEADTLDPGDPRAHLAAAVRTLRPVMAAVGHDQHGLPTPCRDMTVEDLLDHLVMVVRRIACAGRGQEVSTWPVDSDDVPRGAWLDAVVEAAHDVQASWPAEVLDRPTAVPWGVFSGAEVAAIYVNELTVHTWDLAQATGQEVSWDEGALACSWEAINFQLPEADRTPQWDAAKAFLPPGVPWEDPFANAVEVAADAPLIERLVAWNGRTP